MRPFHVRGTDRAVQVVKINYDGDLFFQGSQDGFINCWVTETGERLGNYQTSGAVKTIDITHNSEYIVSGSLEGSIDIYKIQGGVLVGRIRTNKRKARYLEFSFGNEFILFVYQPMVQFGEYEIRVFRFNEILRAFDEQKDEREKNIQMESLRPIKQWSFNDFKIIQASWGFLNKTIVIASAEGELALLKVADLSIIKQLKAHEGEIKQFTISKDFSLMATAANDGCKVFDPETLEQIRYYKYEVPMNAVAISPLLNNEQLTKPHLIVAGGIPARETARTKFQGFDIHICNIIYEEEVGKFLRPINSLDFFPDGRGFVTGEEGGYSRVYKFDQSYWENDIFS